MGSVKIYGDKVNDAKTAARTLEQSLKTTYDRCEELSSYVHSAKWSGKSRDAFLTYIDIIQQYHKDLVTVAAKQTKALNNLDGYIDDFNKDSSVKEVRNL